MHGHDPTRAESVKLGAILVGWQINDDRFALDQRAADVETAAM